MNKNGIKVSIDTLEGCESWSPWNQSFWLSPSQSFSSKENKGARQGDTAQQKTTGISWKSRKDFFLSLKFIKEVAKFTHQGATTECVFKQLNTNKQNKLNKEVVGQNSQPLAVFSCCANQATRSSFIIFFVSNQKAQPKIKRKTKRGNWKLFCV